MIINKTRLLGEKLSIQCQMRIDLRRIRTCTVHSPHTKVHQSSHPCDQWGSESSAELLSILITDTTIQCCLLLPAHCPPKAERICVSDICRSRFAVSLMGALKLPCCSQQEGFGSTLQLSAQRNHSWLKFKPPSTLLKEETVKFSWHFYNCGLDLPFEFFYI